MDLLTRIGLLLLLVWGYFLDPVTVRAVTLRSGLVGNDGVEISAPRIGSGSTISWDLVGNNLLTNSSFEAGSPQPTEWNYQLDSNSSNTQRSAEGIHSGKYGLKFIGGGSGNYGVSQPSTKTIGGRTYTLSGYVKVVNAPKIRVSFGFWNEKENTRGSMKDVSFSATKDWSRIFIVVSTSGQSIDTINWFPLIEVYGLTSGSVYLDDLQLTEGTVLSRYDASRTMNAGVGGGLTIGDGSIVGSNTGDLYPATSGLGSLGTSDHKWSALYLNKATLDSNGGLSLSGGLSLGSALTVGNGGTGATSFTSNGILYGNGTSAVSVLSPGTSGYVLSTNGANSAPSWVDVSSLSVSSLPFSSITTATNTSATLTVGSGAVINRFW